MTDTAQIAGIAVIVLMMGVSFWGWFKPLNCEGNQHQSIICHMWLMAASVIIAVAIW